MKKNNSVLALFSILSVLITGCLQEIDPLSYYVVHRQIVVDGDPGEWEEIEANIVQGDGHLWIGQGMKREYWEGNSDLSYQWKAAWFNNQLFFLVEVVDDTICNFEQPNSWLNDCVEICIDPHNMKGSRIDTSGHLPTSNGYETHFLPDMPPKPFLDALVSEYEIDKPQIELFANQWNGSMEVAYVNEGYLLEVGFTIPDLTLVKGLRIGAEIGVCDDDGAGRKSLMMWSGKQIDFWITMEEYGVIILD